MGGMFVVVDGPDGAGKTTLVERLARRLRDAGHDLVQVREPGGTASAEVLRDLVLHRSEYEWTSEAELFLILAARAELVRNVIRPALDRAGTIVLSDRFVLSTIAYQAVGRGLPEPEVRAAIQLATRGLVPDLTLVLDVQPDVGLRRQEAQGKAPDRIERAAPDLHERVAAFFSRAEGSGIVHLDGNQGADEVEVEAWLILQARLDGTTS